MEYKYSYDLRHSALEKIVAINKSETKLHIIIIQGWVSDSLKAVYDKTRHKLCPKPVYTASFRQWW